MLKSLALKVPQIRAFVSDRKALQIANAQLSDAMAHANVLPIAPRHLQERVVGTYAHDFLSSATRHLRGFEAILQSVGKGLSDFLRVLDMGVGCGRVIRRYHELYPAADLVGADIDPEAIGWLNENYGPRFGRFLVLPHMPPSQLERDSFDLVYAISVFTHLDEQMQFAWLRELQRVTEPEGCLLLTVHGRWYRNNLPPPSQRRADTGFYYSKDAPETSGLPSFYRVAYHTREYVVREWARFFEIVSYQEEGIDHQDLVLCRKR
jgi:SAM-dependent methyltransferase